MHFENLRTKFLDNYFGNTLQIIWSLIKHWKKVHCSLPERLSENILRLFANDTFMWWKVYKIEIEIVELYFLPEI